jgi:hypothetical protein
MFRLGLSDQPRWLSISLPLLLLANVILLAAVLGAFGPDPTSGWLGTPREPARLRQQVRTERMELQPVPPASGAAPAGGTRSAGPAGKVVATSTASAGSDSQCVEIGGFSTQAARRAAEDLSGGTWQVEQFERREQVRWWIHLPAQPTRENLERKLAELRRRNVTDYSVVTSGAPEAESFTVSLGLFREREHAEHYLEMLRGQGVRTAVLVDAPRPFARSWLRVRGADEAARARLDAMRQRYGAETLLNCGAA